MSDKVAEDLAALDRSLGLADPEEDNQPTEETPAAEADNVETEEEQPVTDPTVETPEAEPEEKLYAGNFKTVEELERGYQELRSAEGRRSQELGELRKTVEQLAERLPEEDDGYVPMDDSTAQWFDSLMDENPVQAMEWARQNDSSGVYYNRGMQQWYDTNPAQAATYQNAVIVQALREELREEFSQQTQPLQKQAETQRQQQTFNEAWSMLAAEVPDLGDYAEAMTEESKVIPQGLMNSLETAKEKKQVLHTLYRLAKGANAVTVQSAQEQAETETKQQNRAAKLSGTAQQTRAVTPEQKSDDDALLEAIPGFTDYLDKRSAPVE